MIIQTEEFIALRIFIALSLSSFIFFNLPTKKIDLSPIHLIKSGVLLIISYLLPNGFGAFTLIFCIFLLFKAEINIKNTLLYILISTLIFILSKIFITDTRIFIGFFIMNMLFYLKDFKKIKEVRTRSIDYDYTYRAASLPPDNYKYHLDPHYYDTYIDSSLRDAEEIALYTALRYNLNSNRGPNEERFGNDEIDKTIDGKELTKEEMEEFIDAWDEVKKKIQLFTLYFCCTVNAIYIVFLWYLYMHKIYQKIEDNKYHILFSAIVLMLDFFIILYISKGDYTLAFLRLITVNVLIYFAHRFFYDKDEDENDEYEYHDGITVKGLKKIKSLSSDFTLDNLFNDMILSSLILIIIIPNYAIYDRYASIVFLMANFLGFCV